MIFFKYNKETSILVLKSFLAGEVMSAAQEFLEDQMHPTKIIAAYRKALDDIEDFLQKFAKTIDPNNDEEMKTLVNSALGTKFIRYENNKFNIDLRTRISNFIMTMYLT